jgi:hypothetical protein
MFFNMNFYFLKIIFEMSILKLYNNIKKIAKKIKFEVTRSNS